MEMSKRLPPEPHRRSRASSGSPDPESPAPLPRPLHVLRSRKTAARPASRARSAARAARCRSPPVGPAKRWTLEARWTSSRRPRRLSGDRSMEQASAARKWPPTRRLRAQRAAALSPEACSPPRALLSSAPRLRQRRARWAPSRPRRARAWHRRRSKASRSWTSRGRPSCARARPDWSGPRLESSPSSARRELVRRVRRACFQGASNRSGRRARSPNRVMSLAMRIRF